MLTSVPDSTQVKTQWILKVPVPVVDLSLTVEVQVVDSVDLAVDIRSLSSSVVVEQVVEEDIRVVVNSSSFILEEAFRLGWSFVLYSCVSVNRVQE